MLAKTSRITLATGAGDGVDRHAGSHGRTRAEVFSDIRRGSLLRPPAFGCAQAASNEGGQDRKGSLCRECRLARTSRAKARHEDGREYSADRVRHTIFLHTPPV